MSNASLLQTTAERKADEHLGGGRFGPPDQPAIETGSLYPALHRLEAQGLVRSDWRVSDKGKRAKYYQLTAAGKRHLTAEHSRWDRFVLAMSRVLRPSESKEDHAASMPT